MVLVGQYDSPFVRRVAVSLRLLGFEYAHDTRSVFGDFDAMRQVNPLGRIPSLVLDDGEVLIDSAAILDWLDQSVGPARALVPPAGPERGRALRLIALATGAIDKVGAAAYERLLRPAALRWPEWTLTQALFGSGVEEITIPTSWSLTVEECFYASAPLIFLGAAALQADDSHLSIDTMRHYSPPAMQRLLDLFRRFVIAACSALLVYQGIALSARMWPLEFPAMGVTRSLLYLSVPIGFAFTLLFALRGAVRREPPGAVEPSI